MRGLAAAMLGLALAISSCAIVGYDLDGYGPAGQGGGGGNSTGSHLHTSGSSSVGGSGSCSPDDSCYEPVHGFEGPFAFYTGTAGVDCAAPWGQPGSKGGTLPDKTPVTCNACSCGLEPCAPSVFDFYSGSCATLIATSAVPTADGCQNLVSPIGNISSATARVVNTNPGISCTPGGGGEATHPPAKFADEALLCSPSRPGGVCGQGGTCYAKPSSPFETSICVSASGDVTCPSSYPNAFKMFDKLVDKRTCSDCQCGAANATCSTADIFEPDTTCTGGTFTFFGDGVCHTITPGSTVAAILIKVDPPCAATGGKPSGDVSVAQRTTVCCR
jgi:hypothetical protein